RRGRRRSRGWGDAVPDLLTTRWADGSCRRAAGAPSEAHDLERTMRARLHAQPSPGTPGSCLAGALLGQVYRSAGLEPGVPGHRQTAEAAPDHQARIPADWPPTLLPRPKTSNARHASLNHAQPSPGTP